MALGGAYFGESMFHSIALSPLETDWVAVIDGQEITEAGLDTKSPKQLISRVIKSLLESDHVEEVYGTDEDISRLLRSLLGDD